ncbi:short chain dehydrogenase [Magnetospirillum fulvum MGU-K5]|uniref:Short chain dehydrogenase n=1 Tax=Magnetospirillum fulvum MGU-K5 TaxID=1316936 RepID=S9SEZ0_MAGFU|nr:short chain dehydrogenase [Magnetospirillum fulvum MGU-K5]
MTIDSFSPALPRVALVTGAARRIGRAIAFDLARAGFAVAVHHSRSGPEAEAVVAAIVAQGGGRWRLPPTLPARTRWRACSTVSRRNWGRWGCWSTMPRPSNGMGRWTPRARAGTFIWRSICAPPSC